jgi:transcriptional antiterminator NusG
MEQRDEGFEAYCISCRTGMEEKAALLIREAFDIQTIAPVKVKREWRSKRWEQFTRALLPGYIFAYAQGGCNIRQVKMLPSIQSVLKYSDGTEALMGLDRAFAMWLAENKGIIGLSAVLREGERVKVIDGPLKEMEGNITVVDKRKQIAKVVFSICGSPKHFWLSFDYLK